MTDAPTASGIIAPRSSSNVTSNAGPASTAGQLAADDGGTPIPAPDPKPGSNTGKSYEGSITVRIGTTTLTLQGSLRPQGFVVDYHAPFETAFPLGSITDAAYQIALTVGDASVANQVVGAFNDVAGLPVVGTILEDLLKAKVKLTDLAFDTTKKDADGKTLTTYQIGLVLDFQDLPTPPTLFGITLVSLGFKATQSGAPKAAEDKPEPVKKPVENTPASEPADPKR